MTSLVIGASGQVGSLLYRYLQVQTSPSRRQTETCAGTYCHHEQPGLCRLDLRDYAGVRKILEELRPDVCFLPGGLTFVDYAESHPQECREINGLGVANLAEILVPLGTKLVLFSTDHVFGECSAPVADARGPAHPGSEHAWREDDPVAPLSAYAKSKVQAEQLVREMLPKRHLILRTSWVFGPDPQEKNFVYRVLRTLKKGEQLLVPSDQHGQPTFGPDLAQTAVRLVNGGATGTFHVVGPEYLSRLAWVEAIAETFGLPMGFIVGRPTSGFPSTARRPLYVRLARQKLSDQLGFDPIRSPHQGLKEMLMAKSCIDP